MTDKIAAAVSNGIHHSQEQAAAAEEAAKPPLQKAMERHGRAVLAINTLAGGQVVVDPRQLLVDSELTAVRLEVMFLALINAGIIDGADMAVKLADKPNAESGQMEGMLVPQIQVAPAGILKS